MKLSSAIIVNKLSGQFLYDLTGKVEDSLDLSRPVFLTSGSIPQNGCILIGKFRRNEDIPKIKVHSLLITQGRLLEEVRDKFDCILNFADEVDLYEVINYVHAVFNLYDEWMRDISDLARQGCSLTELLDRSQTIFTNPLMIHNKDFKFIAYSSIIDGSKKLSFLLEQSSSADILNNFMIDREYRDTFSAREARIFPAHLTGVRTVYKNIFSHGKLLCRLLIAETLRNLQNSDLMLLEILAEQAKYVLLREQPIDESPVSTLNNTLQNMLKGLPVEDYLVQRTLSSYGWTPDLHYFCIKFQVDHIDVQNHSAFALVDFWEKTLPGSCAFELENDIVLYINLDANGSSRNEIIHMCAPYIRDRNLKAGISNVYQGFYRCYQLLYKQACIALDVGLRCTPFKWIHQFNDVAGIYLLDRCTSELPASMVCAPEILEIYRYDEQHHSDYYHTLKTYLGNNMQPVATAKELFIHRTTFLYRLDKITQRFKLDLHDPKRRLMYCLSIALLDQASHSST